MNKKIYIYGVIAYRNKKTDREENPGHTAKDNPGKEVYTIPYQDVACVVSNADKDSFNAMPKEALGRHLVEHQTTVEKIMKAHTVIPFKFGTIVEGENEVERVLQAGYREFKEKLEILDKKIELDVIALWNDLNSAIKKMGEENTKIKAFKDEIKRLPPEETLQDRIKIGSMIKDAVDEKRSNLQTEMLDFLKEKVTDFQKHELMDDKMILNCAFLLEKDKEKEFDQAMNELNNRYNEEINFRCIGPLPPYSFSAIELKRVGCAELNEARKLLGLNEEATIHEIKESYRQLALKFHPDNNPDNPNLKKRFGDIAKAYKLLTNYCQQVAQGENCSFKEAEGKDFISIDILKV